MSKRIHLRVEPEGADDVNPPGQMTEIRLNHLARDPLPMTQEMVAEIRRLRADRQKLIEAMKIIESLTHHAIATDVLREVGSG